MKDARIVAEIRQRWQPRKKNTHKGDYGRVLIVAGAVGMHGAACLSGLAALRAGAGLVTLVVPKPIYPLVGRRSMELMVYPAAALPEGSFSLTAFNGVARLMQGQNVLVLGPGLSRRPGTLKFVRKLVKYVRCSVVLDADALSAFEGKAEELRALAGRLVITPHAGEYRRLFRRMVSTNLRGRIADARAAAKKIQACVVLKGHQTVVALPSGQSFVNPSGNPGMATAGTGDVLAGVIAALIGQGFSVYDAARFGVYLHGAAGDVVMRKKGEVSMIASDLLEALPAFIKRMRKRK